MSIFHKFIYRFNAVSVEISADFFTETDVDPKVHMEIQGTQNNQNNLEKEEQIRGLRLPDFKTIYTQ